MARPPHRSRKAPVRFGCRVRAALASTVWSLHPLIVKLEIEPQTDAQMLSEFPRRSRTPHWFLRVKEVSNGHWVVIARDRWGREISRSGGEPELETMIEDCEEYAAATSRATNERRLG